MINILFYGNCQLFCIMRTMNLSPDKYMSNHIPCWTTDYNKQTFTDVIQKCDIIITQPINDDYRKVDYLSTNYVINNSKPNCKIVIFDSCHFDFYYVDLTYKFVNNDVLHKPSDYHYDKMIECYHNNYSIEYYIENYVNNEDLKTSEELEIVAENSLNKLKNRYNNAKEKYTNNNKNVHIYFISTYEFIKNNYKNKLLFYSMNHPTKFVIQYICEEINKNFLLSNNINYDIDDLSNPKSILYKCIQKNVTFDISNHSPSILGKTSIHEIAQIYYNTYKEIGLT